MSFLEPAEPPFDLDEWRRKPHLARLKPCVQDWGAERVRVAELRLPALRREARHLLGRRAVRDLADPGLGDAREHRRLVDRADRLPEADRLDPALGDPRPRRRVDAAQLPLQPADRRPPLLAAAGDHAPPAVARQGAAHGRVDPHACSTSRSTRGSCRLGDLPARHRAATDVAGTDAGRLPVAGIAVLLGLLALLGLRDKVSFLGARPEIYAPMLAVGLFSVDELDRRLAVHLPVHLVGRRLVEAEQALPLRRLGDDEQRAPDPLEVVQAAPVARLPRGHAPLEDVGGDRPLRHRPGVPLAAAC